MAEVIPSTPGQSVIAGTLRRLGALVSDTLIAVAVAMIATVPFLPLADGKALVPSEVGWLLASAYRAWILLVMVVFFGYMWVRSGQTVGMLAWRLRVEREDGRLLDWRAVVSRCFWNLLPWLPGWCALSWSEQVHTEAALWLARGLLLPGVMELFSSYWSPDGRTWADRWSASRVVKVPFIRR